MREGQPPLTGATRRRDGQPSWSWRYSIRSISPKVCINEHNPGTPISNAHEGQPQQRTKDSHNNARRTATTMENGANDNPGTPISHEHNPGTPISNAHEGQRARRTARRTATKKAWGKKAWGHPLRPLRPSHSRAKLGWDGGVLDGARRTATTNGRDAKARWTAKLELALFDTLDFAQGLYQCQGVDLCAMHTHGPMQVRPRRAAGSAHGAEKRARRTATTPNTTRGHPSHTKGVGTPTKTVETQPQPSQARLGRRSTGRCA